MEAIPGTSFVRMDNGARLDTLQNEGHARRLTSGNRYQGLAAALADHNDRLALQAGSRISPEKRSLSIRAKVAHRGVG